MNQKTLHDKLQAMADKRVDGFEEVLKTVYRKAFDNIDKELAALNGKKQLELYELYKKNRLALLQKNITQIINNLGNKEVIDSLGDIVRLGYASQSYELIAAGADIIFTGLSPVTVEAAVYHSDQTIDIIKTFKKDWTKELERVPKVTSFLKNILDRNNLAQKIRVWEALNTGLVQGISYRSIAKGLQDVFERGFNDATRVLRTEGHKAQIVGQLASADYAASRGVEIEDFWIATGDLRTRTTHRSMEGQRRDKDGLFTFANGIQTVAPGLSGVAKEDINCRCRLGHIVDGIEPDERRIKDPTTGKYEIVSFGKSFQEYEEQLMSKKKTE